MNLAGLWLPRCKVEDVVMDKGCNLIGGPGNR